MTFKEVITAPEELIDVEKDLEELLNQVPQDSSLEETVIKFSEIIGKGFMYYESNTFFGNNEEAEQYRKEFFAAIVNRSNQILAEELAKKGIKSVLFVTPTGMQGAGKGTYGDTNAELASAVIQSNANSEDFFDTKRGARKNRNTIYSGFRRDNDRIINRVATFAKALDVKTGTGGIFFHANSEELCKSEDEKEYFRLFNPLKTAMGASGGKFVESNIVAIALNLYLAHKVRASEEGVSTFNIDLYPRSQEQVTLMQELQSELARKNITADHKVIDYKILPQEDISFLNQNKSEVVRLIEAIKGEIVDFYKSISKEYSVDQYKFTFEVLQGKIEELFSPQTLGKYYGEESIADVDNRIVETMRKEALEAARRAKGRFEGGRTDDAPIFLVKRITDYFTKTYVNAFKSDEGSLIMISTLGSPSEVAQRTFCALYGFREDAPEIKYGGRYYEMISHYQAIVAKKVRGGFVREATYNRYIRYNKNRPPYREIVHWNSDETVVLYTIETEDLKRITLRITQDGVAWFDDQDEKGSMNSWKTLTKLGATKNWSYTIKNLAGFRDHFIELQEV